MSHKKRIDALAVAVGVMEPNPDLEARERYNRAGGRLSAIAFGVVVGTGLLWSHMIGLIP
ncbi:hypothetical protein [Corynebacterium glutamicum]|uniref:hypothetical protein n=1 Tax=Corynebacterium glutamicum TaxID=1718 RepID=UPI001B8C2FF2|nr:hypothetical protein [Corynebacterium glutamicum]